MKSFSQRGCLLTPLSSIRLPNFSVAGSSATPRPPALCARTHTHTCTHAWTNGVFIPTFMKVLEPWVGVWLVPEEERTQFKVWA